MGTEALIRIALFTAEEILKQSPEAFAKLQIIFSKPGVSVEDLRTERAEISSQTYAQFTPGTAIPPEART